MKRIKALQPFVGVWGNQSYVFTEGEEKDVPDGLADSVTRSGTLAVRVETTEQSPAAKKAPAAPVAAEAEVSSEDASAAGQAVKRSRKP